MERVQDTPVALFVFNRPGTTERVLEQIAEVQPAELYVVADGPREAHPGDAERCAETRALVEDLDWACDLYRNYSDTNLGLRERFHTGIDWLFAQVDEAIILEDDCLPDPTFFEFCRIMLDEYRDNPRVMDVTGTNFLGTWKADRQDYHFSIYGGIWGWATWHDAWEHYDPRMTRWADDEAREQVRRFIDDANQYAYQRRVNQRTFDSKLDTWDYQWVFAKHLNSGLSVVPSKNLIRNIGFGHDATNTTVEESPLTQKALYSMEFPVERNASLIPDREYDRRFHQLRASIWQRSRLLRPLRDLYVNLIQDR